MSKLEECAKIICMAAGDDWQQGKAYHIATAQAVIDCLREPTPEMIKTAMREAVLHPAMQGDALNFYRAIIYAFLEPKD